MKMIINKTSNISSDLLEKIAKNSPWEGLSKQLLTEKPTDIWVKAVKENISSCLLSDAGELVSYGCFGNKWELFEEIVSSCGFKLEEIFVGIYLYTVVKYQNQGNAKRLKAFQLSYIKEKYPKIKYLLGSTSKKELLKKYKSWWAKSIDAKITDLLRQEWLEKEYFYYYEIR